MNYPYQEIVVQRSAVSRNKVVIERETSDKRSSLTKIIDLYQDRIDALKVVRKEFDRILSYNK